MDTRGPSLKASHRRSIYDDDVELKAYHPFHRCDWKSHQAGFHHQSLESGEVTSKARKLFVYFCRCVLCSFGSGGDRVGCAGVCVDLVFNFLLEGGSVIGGNWKGFPGRYL